MLNKFRIGFILTDIISDYQRQNKRSKVLAPGQCHGAVWRQVDLAETTYFKLPIKEIYKYKIVYYYSN